MRQRRPPALESDTTYVYDGRNGRLRWSYTAANNAGVSALGDANHDGIPDWYDSSRDSARSGRTGAVLWSSTRWQPADGWEWCNYRSGGHPGDRTGVANLGPPG